LSAEYLLASGTKDVVLCERGIRTFETYTRNTLDISAIPVVKKLSHLPVIVDPSHAVGIRAKVSPAALAAIAAGADGLTVEVHPNPDAALSDGPQSLYPEQFEKLMRDVEALAPVVGKELLRTPRPSLSLASSSVKNDNRSTEEESNSVGFSGDSGAFAEQAIIRSFGEDTQRTALPSFSAIFDAVLDGSVRFGMIPVENSLTGSIHENYDLFIRYPDVAIVGEIKLRIVHCLIADEKADIDSIKIVRSHPQGFAQCKEFLDTHPDWQRESVNSTSSAVVSIVRDGATKVAAIASETAAKIHGLHVLKTGIETNPQNYTRFVIISRLNGDKAPIPPNLCAEKLNKASIIFSVNDEPGALFECLKVLSERGINLSKLESRPIPGQPWRYMFYADVGLANNDSAFEQTLEALKDKCDDFRLLGMYHAAV
jgi:3-deoxy-7-phosphoheptulonate synthase